MIRAFDIIFSLLAIAVLFPFMLPIMIALKLTGEHDIFYRQMRIGRQGEMFGLLKFATMKRNSSKMEGGLITQKNDSRILPLGRFLRATKINELPQLLNVLEGTMSFVGPRPFVDNHYELYPPEAKAAIRQMPPGITGVGSLVFRNEEDILGIIGEEAGGSELGRKAANNFHDQIITPYKGELETWYLNNKGVWLYFKLIFLTAWGILNPGFTAIHAFDGLPKVPSQLNRFIGGKDGK